LAVQVSLPVPACRCVMSVYHGCVPCTRNHLLKITHALKRAPLARETAPKTDATLLQLLGPIRALWHSSLTSNPVLRLSLPPVVLAGWRAAAVPLHAAAGGGFVGWVRRRVFGHAGVTHGRHRRMVRIASTDPFPHALALTSALGLTLAPRLILRLTNPNAKVSVN